MGNNEDVLFKENTEPGVEAYACNSALMRLRQNCPSSRAAWPT